MASLTLRSIKGVTLTNDELDANFTALNTELGQKLVASSNLSDLANAATARSNLGLGNVENKSSATILGELTSSNVTGALGFTPQATLVSGTSIKTVNGNSVLGEGNIQIDGGVTSFNTRTGAISLSSGDVTDALGFTPLSNATSYLPLSGGTLTGATTLNGGSFYVSSAASGQTYNGTIHIRDNEATGANNSFAGIAFSSSPGADYVIGKYTSNSSGSLQVRNHTGSQLWTMASDGSVVQAGNLIINGANQVLHSGNYGSYALPLSGGAVSGYTTFDGGLSSGSGGGQRIYAYRAGTVRQGFGVDMNGQSYNSDWFGSAGPSNTGTLSLGFVSHSDGTTYSEIVRVNASGGMNVLSGALQEGGNQVLHAGNYSSYAAPASHTHSYLPLSGGQLSGDLDLDANYLRFNQSGTRSWNMRASGGNLDLNSGDGYGSFRYNSNALLHAGNYSSYSLPLTGGTLTGDLTFSSGTSLYKQISSSSANYVTHIVAPKGAMASWDGAVTGAIKIRLPVRAIDSMWSMRIRIYHYDSNATSEYVVGNYSYGSGAYNASAYCVSSGNMAAQNVRLGNDGSYDCVWIGETETTWSYPVVSVTEFTTGFRNAEHWAWYNNWQISTETAFGTVGVVIYPSVRLPEGSKINTNAILHAGNYTSYSPSLTGSGASGTWGISVTGNAATAGGLAPWQFFNNMGNNHGDITNFDTVPGFGSYFFQQGTTGPTGVSDHQWYGFTLGLGSNYPVSSYASQLYWPRAAQNSDAYLYVRDRENSAWGSWRKTKAGYADTAGSASQLGGVDAANYFRTDGTYPNADMNSPVEGYWHVINTAANLPEGYYGHRWDYDHLNNGQWVAQMYSPTSGDAGLWFRQRRNYEWQTWRKMLDSSNYSSYALPLSGGTLSGTLYAPKVIIDVNNDLSWGGTWSEGKPTIAGTSSGISVYPIGNAGGLTLTLSNAATNSSVPLQQSGNQVLHAGNYGDYSVTRSEFRSFGTITINPNGDNANCTTAEFMTHLTSLGFFNYPSAVGKCVWSYAGNNDLTDTGFGTIDLAGCVIETWKSGNEKHVRLTRPTTGAGGFQVLVYVDHGSGYSPGWRAMMTNENIGSFALPLSGGKLTGNLRVEAADPKIIFEAGTGENFGALEWVLNGYENDLYARLKYNVWDNFFEFTDHSAGGAAVSILKLDATGLTHKGSAVLHAGNKNDYTYPPASHTHSYLPLSGGTMTGDLTVTRMKATHSLDLNTYATVNPSSNVFLYSQGNDRDSWLYLDSADTGSNWGIYHRQIDSEVSGLPGNSIGFVGGGSNALQAWISLANGSANFAGALTQGGNQVLHAGNYNSYSPSLTGSGASGTWGITTTADWLHSDRDFPNGTLVTTNINYANWAGDAFVLEIRGNSYGNIVPLDLQYQGYIYSDTIISHGGLSNGLSISGMVALNVGGNLCFWFPTQGYWNGYKVRVYVPYGGRPSNRVTSITSQSKPSGTKEVELSSGIRQSLHSGNYGSYALPLSGGTIAGNGFIDFGPNSAWGVTLRVGGNGHGGTDRASVVTTNGNLHLDGTASSGVYLNWYATSTTGTYFGNGAGGQVGRVTASGSATFSGLIDTPAGYVSNGNPWGTANSAFFPSGITTAGGTNWIYGSTYLGNAPGNGSGAEVAANGYFNNTVSSGPAMHVRRTGSASVATNSYTALFEQTYGDHSWGIVTEFRAGGSGGTDRPSILFSNGYNSNTWSVGFGYFDDQFRIRQNHGHRNGDWGYERFRIDTDGTPYFNGNVALHAGNYTNFNGHLRALGNNDGMDFNTTSYNSMYYAWIANSANKPSSYNYPYGTVLTFDPGQGVGGRAQFYVSHAGNDLAFRGGWNGNDSWQSWNKVLTDANYTSYSPSLTGGGASGTWGIAISGNAATASNADTFDGIDSPRFVYGSNYRKSNAEGNMNNTDTSSGFWYGSNPTGNPFGDWTHWINSIGADWNPNYGFQLAHAFHSDAFAVRRVTNGSWGGWRTVVDSSNYSSYALPLSGGTLTGVLTITNTNDVQLMLQSTDSWTGISFDDGAGGTADYIWHNGNNKTFAIGGGGADVAGKKLHVHGGMTIGSGYSTTTNATNGLNVEGAIQQAGNQVLHAGNHTSYSPSLTGTGASGSWGISITGSSSSVSGLTLTNSANGVNPDNVTQNHLGYNTSVSLFGQSDGGLYSSAYSQSWIHQIYGDFRTGQIAIRGKNSGAWQAWRTVLDSSNYNSYALPLSGGTLTGNLLFAATAGDVRTIGGGSSGNTTLVIQAGGISGTGANIELTRDYLAFVDANETRFRSVNAATLYFTVNSTGVTSAGNVTAYSDERLKSDWALLPTDFIERLATVKNGTYTRIDTGQRQAGSSAQDWQQLLPEVVSENTDEAKTLALAYGNAALVSAVELAKRVVEQDKRIKRLEALVEKLIGD